MSASYPQMPHIPQMPVLPSRTGSIVTLVLGLLTLFIVAPISFFGATLAGAAVQATADEPFDPTHFVRVVNVHDSIEVGALGMVELIADATTGAVPEQCALHNSTGVVLLKSDYDPTYDTLTFSAHNMKPGTYDLTCDPRESTDQYQFHYVDASAITSRVASGFFVGLVVSVVVSFIGLVLTVVGTVWLVKVNKRRRMAMTGVGF